MSNCIFFKIAEFHQKAFWIPPAKKLYKTIEISEDGLELIELLCVDCTTAEGEWHSDSEIKIDDNGYVIANGVQTKEFWN